MSARPEWSKVANIAQKICTLYTFSSLVYSLLPKDNFFRTNLRNSSQNVAYAKVIGHVVLEKISHDFYFLHVYAW